MKIESHDWDIRTMLSSGYYRIPRFQRPYSWDRENIQEFWDDIVRDEPTDYFIGSMVVFKEAPQIFGVVDGQQRLTTITLMLCVIRNLCKDHGFTDLAEGIHQLVERRNIDNKLQFVVSTETSYPYFQDHIQKWGDATLDIEVQEEERALQAAFDQLRQLLGAVVDAIVADPSTSVAKKQHRLRKRMTEIRDSLLSLSLIFVQLGTEDDAYVIFETLNTRGKDLSLKDLVKNHLTKLWKSRNAQIDSAKIKWGQLLEVVEGSSVPLDVDTFLHHWWLSRFDFVPAKELFKTLKKKITAANVKQFTDELLEDSKSYRSIHDVPYGKWSKQERRTAKALEALMLFRVVQPTPCVLSMVREYRNKKIHLRHLDDTLVAIEKFHFLFTAITSQRSSGGISKMYAMHGRELFEASGTQEAVQVLAELKKKLRARIPKQEEFEALFPEVVYTDNLAKQRRLVRYVLTSIGQLNSDQAVDYEQLTVEHIAPQSEISDVMPEAVVGQLGNLLLVTKELNQKLRNKSFSEKKKILGEAGVPLTFNLEAAKQWGAEEIVERTRLMAKLSYEKVWRI